MPEEEWTTVTPDGREWKVRHYPLLPGTPEYERVKALKEAEGHTAKPLDFDK